jgi:hypothetical protein
MIHLLAEKERDRFIPHRGYDQSVNNLFDFTKQLSLKDLDYAQIIRKNLFNPKHEKAINHSYRDLSIQYHENKMEIE